VKNARRLIATWVLGLSAPLSIQAAAVPFAEDFTGSVSNWADNSGLSLLTHNPTGGPDGGSYASTTTSLFGWGGDSIVLFRGQDEFNSSNGAFEGNWIAQDINHFSALVRHSAPMPLNFFTRFSGPANFPGGTAVRFIPVLPNTWTQLEFDIDPSNPAFVTFEGMTFGDVFVDVGHVQIGVSVPESLGASMSQFTFGLDKISIAVPEPSTLTAALAGGLLLVARRRRK